MEDLVYSTGFRREKQTYSLWYFVKQQMYRFLFNVLVCYYGNIEFLYFWNIKIFHCLKTKIFTGFQSQMLPCHQESNNRFESLLLFYNLKNDKIGS